MDTYETDPKWIAARTEAEAPTREDETPSDGFTRRARAAFRMFDIETAAEAKR